MDLGVGDYIECIEGYIGDFTINEGSLYVVDQIINRKEINCTECSGHGVECRHDGIKLVTPKIPDESWWCAGRFKPVYRPRNDLFICEDISGIIEFELV